LRTSATDRLTILTNGNVGIGTATPATKLQVNGDVSFSAKSIISTTGTVNNYARGNSSVISITATGVVLTGIANPFDGTVVYIYCSNSFYLNHDDPNSTASNRIITSGKNTYVYAQTGVTLIYDGTISRWRVLDISGGGSNSIDRLTTVARTTPSYQNNQNKGKIVFDVDKGHLYVWEGDRWRRILDDLFDSIAIIAAQPTNSALADRFGNAVAIKGDWAVVGAVGANSSEGEAYVYQRVADGWVQVKKLREDLINATVDAGAKFGAAVDIDILSGYPVIVVGAIEQDGGVGKAFVFRYRDIDPTAAVVLDWAYETILAHPSPAVNDNFGESVAISGNRIIVGARLDDPIIGGSPQTDFGSACVYHATQTGSQPTATFAWAIQGSTNSQATFFNSASGGTGDNFGWDVDIEGDYAVVSSPNWASNNGRVDMYKFSGGTWSLLRSFIIAQFPTTDIGSKIGYSLSLSGAVLVLGVPGEDYGAVVDVGAILVLTNASTTWTNVSAVTSVEINNPYAGSGNEATSQFGWSVDMNSNYIIVGSPFYDVTTPVVTDIGLATAYKYPSVAPIKIDLPKRTTGYEFGRSVSISDDGTFVIGEPKNIGTWKGTVHFGNASDY
jgi:FG-GAP repeat